MLLISIHFWLGLHLVNLDGFPTWTVVIEGPSDLAVDLRLDLLSTVRLGNLEIDLIQNESTSPAPHHGDFRSLAARSMATEGG